MICYFFDFLKLFYLFSTKKLYFEHVETIFESAVRVHKGAVVSEVELIRLH